MSKSIAALGVAILVMGVSMGLWPDRFFALTDWESQGGLYIAASIRIVAGLILIAGARASRYPVGLRVLGAVVLFAGVVLLLLPLDLWVGLIGWIMGWHATVFRIGGGVGGTLLGLLLVYAARPEQSAEA